MKTWMKIIWIVFGFMLAVFVVTLLITAVAAMKIYL